VLLPKPEPKPKKARKRPRRERRSTVAQLKKRADALWREIVLTRDGKRCMARAHNVTPEPCGGPLQADHLFGRKKLRWDPDGGATVDAYCHRRITFDQAAHAMLGLRMLGRDEYERLLEQANQDRGRHTILHYEVEAVVARLEARLRLQWLKRTACE